MTALVVIGGIVVGFGGAELAVRWKQITQFGTEKSAEKSKKYYVDPESGLRLPVPSTQHGKIRINALGFRGEELAVPKPPARIRFLFLGASTTYDPYIDHFKSTWPYVAVDTLKQIFPKCDFDLANAGVVGMGTKHLKTYFSKVSESIEPTVAVVLTNDMNLRLDEAARRNGVDGADHFKPSWLGRHSLFWGKVEKNAQIIGLRRGANRTAGKLNVAPDEITPGFEDELHVLVSTILSKNTLPVLVTNMRQFREGQPDKEQRTAMGGALFFMPYMTAPGLLAMLTAYNGSIRRVAEAEGVPFIDPTPEISGTLEYFEDAAHFSKKGAKRAGELIGTALSTEPRIRDIINKVGSGCAASSN